MSMVAVVVGVVAVVAVVADMVNTLVTTSTSQARWWLTSVLYRGAWRVMRAVAEASPSDRAREVVLATFAPVSVLLLLLAWVTQQVIGFGLIWWGVGGVSGAEGLFDAIYYSGVVYFTLGFGELVPTGAVPRVGALVEAMAGVATTALVIGYLPSLYGAYSERERKLMTLDDGTEGRIIPVNLLISRAPTGDVDDVLEFLDGWEEWVSGVMETHTTFPMLTVFRSKYRGQNWITALGVLADTALLCQLIVGLRDRKPYWLFRRIVVLFDELTRHADLSAHRAQLDAGYAAALDGGGATALASMYRDLESHGFELIPLADAEAEGMAMRRLFDAQMEYLIDGLLCPRGFWGHAIGHQPQVVADLGLAAPTDSVFDH